MRITILLFTFLMTSVAYAQLDGNTKAKLYFTEAEKYFNQNDYEQAIEYAEKAEKALGSPNPRTLNLKIKAYYSNGNFIKAKNTLDIFIDKHQNNATENIKNETLSYFVRIENAVKELEREEERIARKENALENAYKYFDYVRCNNGKCYQGKVNETYKKTCSTCGGDGWTDGTGYFACRTCYGKGYTGYKKEYYWTTSALGNRTQHSRNVKVTCNKCWGTGKERRNTQNRCHTCNGNKKTSHTRKVNCSVCKGANKILKYTGNYDYLSKSEIKKYQEKYSHKIKNAIEKRSTNVDATSVKKSKDALANLKIESIKKDLLGKQTSKLNGRGWRFDYYSEYIDVKIISKNFKDVNKWNIVMEFLLQGTKAMFYLRASIIYTYDSYRDSMDVKAVVPIKYNETEQKSFQSKN